jgi:trans-aconitate methyltransferase
MDAKELTFHEQFDVVFSNAALHWVVDHRPVLLGVRRSLKKPGRLLFQMAGKGNANEVLSILDNLLETKPWKQYFKGFSFPYGFYSPEEYTGWLREAGLKPEKVELLQKDMKLQGKEGLAGWIRTTWLPYTERVPAQLQGSFIDEIVDDYVAAHPLDTNGAVHVKMVRLEVHATT